MGGNDRIPGQEEVVEYAQTTRRVRTIQFNDDPGRETPFWICQECGNMLYPQEDKATKKLMRVCRNCDTTSDADSNLVFVNDTRPRSIANDAGSDVTKDPTLPRAKGTMCNNCQFDEAVFFQAPMRGDEGMKLIFMCLRCVHCLERRWAGG
jgi:DNA-directed RNA polymerase II subunit RPB9